MTTARRERIRIAALLTASLAAASIDVGTFQAAAPASLAWQAVSGGPMGGAATELVEPISGVLLARVNDVLYRSTDDGRSWLPCRDLPPPSSVGGRPPSARPLWFWSTIAHRQRPNAEATRIPAPDTIELTDPRCEQFGAVNVPPWGGPRGDELAFVAGSNARVAVTPTGVFRSTEPVSTWAQVLAFPRRGRVCAAQNGLGLFVVSDTQLYESTDGGATWRTFPEDPDASRTGTAAAGRSPTL